MPLAAAAGLATFDQGGAFLDLSNELAAIIRADNTSLLSRISMNGVATQVKHGWMEDTLNPNTATEVGTGITNVATTVTMAAGHGSRFRAGSLFRDSAAGKTEVMQVTGVAGDVLTIVRGYGSTSGEAHAAGFTASIIAHPQQESQDPPPDESRNRPNVENFTQIFQKGILISHTLRSINLAGVSDEFAYQVARRMEELMRELDSSVILGIKSGDAGSDTSYRSMGGLLEFTSQAGGNISSVSETLSMDVINAMAFDIWNDGGVPNFILVGGAGKRTISTFDQANRRSDYNTNIAGYVVDYVITDLGFRLEVIVDPWMPGDTCVIGDLSKMNVMPLQNDAMRAEDLAKTGRSHKAQVTGQYTLEIRNAKEAFAFHNNLV